MRKNEYDIILLGCGIAGISLLYYLAKEHVKKRVLVIDKRTKHEILSDTRRMSCWYKADWDFRDLIEREWQNLEVKIDDFEQELHLKEYFLGTLLAKKVFEKMWAMIDRSMLRIEWKNALLDNTLEYGHNNSLQIDGYNCVSDYLFDSRYRDYNNGNITMSGGTWQIECDNDFFNLSTMTFMDFINETIFAYVLPLTKRKAIIEIAENSCLPKRSSYTDTVENYVHNRWKNVTFHFTELQQTQIQIPLNQIVKQSKYIIPIGSRGGMIHKVTGYGLTSIVKETKRMAYVISRNKKVNPYQKRFLYKLSDQYNELFTKDGMRSKKVFYKKVFKRVDPDTILAFLDEQLNTLQYVKVLVRLLT